MKVYKLIAMVDNVIDPLAQLIVDTDELDRQKLTELLNGFCVISKEGQIRPAINYPRLDTSGKILAVLLAQKAVHALNMSATEQISPKQIELISGLPGSTVRNKLLVLRQQRIVDGVNGSYSIPNHAIVHITLTVAEKQEVPGKTVKPKAHVVRKVKPISENLEKLLQIDQAKIGTERLNLLLSSGRYLERSLAVLAIAREIGIESLSPADITQFLKEKIRVNIIRENISLALGRGTKYVDRFRLGQNGAYGYKIMQPGDLLLEKALTNSEEK